MFLCCDRRFQHERAAAAAERAHNDMVDPTTSTGPNNSAATGVKVKNKNAAPVQVSAEQLVGEASTLINDASDGAGRSNGNSAGGRASADASHVGAEGTGRRTAASASPAGNDAPSPKRQRTDDSTQRMSSSDTKPAPTASESSTAATSSSAEAMASKCQTATLFVGNLHPRIGDAHLTKLFSPYGTLNRVSLVKNGASGQPKGYAFVEYASVESARMAIRRVDGRMLLNKMLAVRPAHEKTGAATGNDDGDGTSGGKDIKDKRQVRKEKSEVLSKIEAVKRAIEEKKARAAAGKSFV